MEEDLAHVRWQLERAEAELAEREAEVIDLRVEISAFRLEYDTRVGRKVEELEYVEGQLERYRKRIEQYREWGAADRPRTRFGAGYVPVEEQYRRTWKQPGPVPEAPPKPVSRATRERIKKLYRQLCRRFHPDLTQDPEERAWRTEIMAAINAAYAARSLVELQALSEQPDHPVTDRHHTSEQRLGALRDRLQQVRQRLRVVEREISDLMGSDAMQLSLDVKLARRGGKDLLTEMATHVEKELARKGTELDFLIIQLKQLGIEL